MKKPWYIWLSIIGFMFVFISAVINALNKKDFSIWLRLVGKVFLLFLGYLIMLCISLIILGFISSVNIVVGNIFNVFVILLAYFGGVVITYKLYIYKQKMN